MGNLTLPQIIEGEVGRLVKLTPAAAERIRALLAEPGNLNRALRIYAQPG